MLNLQCLFSHFFTYIPVYLLLLLRAPLPFLVFSFLNFLDLLGLTSSTKSSLNLPHDFGRYLFSTCRTTLNPYVCTILLTYIPQGLWLFTARQNYLPKYIWIPSQQRMYVSILFIHLSIFIVLNTEMGI